MDFDKIRKWIARQPCSPKIRRLRLAMFDRYRYAEEYEKILLMMENLKGAKNS